MTHYKGGYYTITSVGNFQTNSSETLDGIFTVGYTDSTGRKFYRPLSEIIDRVLLEDGSIVKRFKFDY